MINIFIITRINMVTCNTFIIISIIFYKIMSITRNYNSDREQQYYSYNKYLILNFFFLRHTFIIYFNKWYMIYSTNILLKILIKIILKIRIHWRNIYYVYTIQWIIVLIFHQVLMLYLILLYLYGLSHQN